MMNSKLNADIIKRDMMELWKETFHDSNSYIKLVFDTYFTPDNVFVRYEGEKLISALLAVPYRFKSCDKENDEIFLKGLYLCGLATHPEWRKKGIMAQLMEEAEKIAEESGFDLTFLIPADSHLREYYRRKGYQTASYRKRFVLNRSETFEEDEKSKLYIYTIKDFLKQGKKTFVDEIARLCSNIEMDNGCIPTLLHSETDMMTVLVENENSFFLTDCTFNPEYPILAKVLGVIFPEVSEDLFDPLRIVGVYTQEKQILFRENFCPNNDIFLSIAEEAKKTILMKYPNKQIEIMLPYVGESICEGGVEPYAMIKPIKKNGFFSINENSKFDISLMLD